MGKREVIIIGSGPSGLTAAIYAARANLKPLVFAGMKYGGQLMLTTEVENFPGFPEGIQGPELMDNMIEQAKRFGAEIRYEDVEEVDFSEKQNFAVYVGKEEYRARSIILATGSYSKLLGLESEQRLMGRGVSTCATCDGAFYNGKKIALVGGGDSAMEEAIFLTRFAEKVYIVHRRDEFRASKIMSDRALANDKIEVLWNTEVKEVLGEEKVSGLRLWNNQEEEESMLDVEGFFVAIGHVPATSFLQKNSAVEMDDKGFIEITSRTSTNIDGVFVAGDVHDHYYQQAITAAGMGCMAAMDVEKWLEVS